MNSEKQTKEFLDKARNYILKELAGKRAPLENEKQFSKVDQPHKMGSSLYNVYPYRKLLGFLPNIAHQDSPLLYTFFVFEPPEEQKEAFLKEAKKEKSSQDEKIVGGYYLDFTPGNLDFDQTCLALSRMLSEQIYPNKGYSFAFTAATIEGELNFILMFLETRSFQKCLENYLEDKTFDPGVGKKPSQH